MVNNSVPRRGICVFAASIDAMAQAGGEADRAGFDSVWTSELYNRSATITVAALAQSTASCTVGTGILYGVGRSPLMLAAEARDLDELSHGRFILGIGNGTRRMISDWHGLDGEAPATRIEELVPLIRDIWNLDQGPIKHDGRFYHLHIAALPGMASSHTREIPIYTAGVNPRMIESAGRVADGLLGHTLFTPQYIEEVVRPAIARGADHAGRDADEIKIATYTLGACSEDEEQARREAAAMIAFYGSVKSYGKIFEVGGFGDEAERIRSAFAERDVDGMIAEVTDAMIDEFAIAGTPGQVAEKLNRFDGVVDDVVLTVPSFQISPERVAENLSLLTASCVPSN